MSDEQSEQWAQGPELSLNVGMTEQELRATALMASAQAWAGLTSMRGDRSAAVLASADSFLKWLKASDT